MAPDDAPQCQETIYVRDVPRYTGRGPGGFSMHYIRQRCSRRPQAGSDRCYQHQPDWATNQRKARMARK